MMTVANSSCFSLTRSTRAEPPNVHTPKESDRLATPPGPETSGSMRLKLDQIYRSGSIFAVSEGSDSG